MKCYNISDAIAFLAKEYGAENMPTSEETLRRAVRTKKLLVQEEHDPGRKGYTIAEKDLRSYAEERLSRIRARNTQRQGGVLMNAVAVEQPKHFPELYGQYADGKMDDKAYYKELLMEKMKWEQLMYEKQAQLTTLDAQRAMLENDVQSCKNAIEAYNAAIAKSRFME